MIMRSIRSYSKNRNKKTKWGRREFISSLGIFSLAGILPINVKGEEVEQREDMSQIIKVGPYLQFSGKRKMTIRWITNLPCYSWAEYGENPDILGSRVESVNAGLVEANNTIHAIVLDGLEPGKKYYYRIYSKVIEKFAPYKVDFGETDSSHINSVELTDSTKNKISFLVFNDIHGRPESFNHLMQFTCRDQADFILLNGDIFNHMENEEQIIKNLLSPFSGISGETPLVFSRGNHETRGKFARHLSTYFNRGENGFYYSFIAGPAYCIVLDSGEDKADDSQVYAGLVKFDEYRLAQREWLKKEIKKKAFKRAKYKIVFSHIPLFYSNEWHGPVHCRESWADLLNRAEIDLMICGHTHKYGIHPKVMGLHNYPIVIGGGPKDGDRTMIDVIADSNSLHLKMLGDDGTLLDELII